MSKVARVIQTLPLNSSDIAVRSGLSQERVQAISGGGIASLDELRALARGLRMPMRAFAEPRHSDDKLTMLFRQSSASRPDLGIEAAAEFVAAALAVLPPRAELAYWTRSYKPSAETFADAANLAAKFRKDHFGNSPDALIALPELLIDLGGLVLGRLDTSRFEGASLVVDGYAFIFVSPRFAGRMLFTLAHELGHILAHHREARSAIFDTASQIGSLRHRSRTEAFVDTFASNLLMPSEGVGMALREIRAALSSRNEALGDIEILYLALFYGVSFEVAARRCEQLELLPQGGAYSLSDHLKKKHGNAEKLAKRLGLPSRAPISFPRVSPNVLAASIQKIDNGEVSIGWVTDRFGCSASDIYSFKALREQSGASSDRR